MLVFRRRINVGLRLPPLQFAKVPISFTRPTPQLSPPSNKKASPPLPLVPLAMKAISMLGSTASSTPAVAANVVNAPEATEAVAIGALPIAAAAVIAMGDQNPINQIFGFSGHDDEVTLARGWAKMPRGGFYRR